MAEGREDDDDGTELLVSSKRKEELEADISNSSVSSREEGEIDDKETTDAESSFGSGEKQGSTGAQERARKVVA